LLVAAIPARVVQRALLNVLQGVDSINRLVKNPHSFGGVPERSVEHAIRTACQAIASGRTYCLRSDIGGFFTKIPRKEVLRVIHDVLPDDSIADLLESATNLEIANRSELGRFLALMPSEFEGIAQGCCLSPLFGNVLLHKFDSEMNIDPVRTLRYIDDFLILGPDSRSVQKAFRSANGILNRLGLDAYSPGDGSGKASSGPTRRGFGFLGCWITPRIIEPSKSARKAFIARIETELGFAKAKIGQAADGDYSRSLVTTLVKISRMIEGWTKQYSFCNPTKAFRSVDRRVDRLLQPYLASFFGAYRKSKTSRPGRRRLLGVWLAEDALRDPILPIATSCDD
jgi:hypothetical protein